MIHFLWTHAFEFLAKLASGQNPIAQLMSQAGADVAKGYGWAFNPVTLATVACGVIAYVVVAVRRKLGGKK